MDAIYKSIKDMFTEYNKLIKSMDEAYNADSSKGYEPLTDDEKMLCLIQRLRSGRLR